MSDWDAERARRLERACRNPMNWSDGGHWIGTGREPNCSRRERQHTTHIHTIRFATSQAAQMWNDSEDRAIRVFNYSVGAIAALATGGGSSAGSGVVSAVAGFLERVGINRALQGFLVGTGITVGAGEGTAGAPSNVQVGYSLVFRSSYRFYYSPHPWNRNRFTSTLDYEIRNDRGQRMRHINATRTYGLVHSSRELGNSHRRPVIPIPLARRLAQAERTVSTINFTSRVGAGQR